MKLPKKCLPIIFFLGAVLSCATLKDDIFIVSNTAETAQPELGEIELKLVRQLSEFNQAEMQGIYSELMSLLAVPSTDQKYLARVNALIADYYVLSNSARRAKGYAETAIKQNGFDEYAMLVYAKLMKDAEAIDYLCARCERFENSHRLAVYLAHLYYKTGEYENAVAYFDKGLPFLDAVYKNAYSDERNASYQKYAIGSGFSKSSASIIEKEKILLIDMTTLTNENTDAFNVITGNSNWKSSMLADRLRAAGWYRSDAQVATEYAKRKDAAIFLWHLICGGNESKLNYYSNKYRTRSRSPIVDVPLGADFFDAALAMIEKDIVQLIDGKYFSPEAEISGAEFYSFLKKANSMR